MKTSRLYPFIIKGNRVFNSFNTLYNSCYFLFILFILLYKKVHLNQSEHEKGTDYYESYF